MVLKCVLIVMQMVGDGGWFDGWVDGWVIFDRPPREVCQKSHTHSLTWWWQPLPPQRLPPTWPLLVINHKEGRWWWWWWKWCWCWCGVRWWLLLGMCLMAVAVMLWQNGCNHIWNNGELSDVVTKCKATLSWDWCCVSWPVAIYNDTTCPF